jgi:Regulator of chromosome condensation (RCC1) repeat
MRSRFALGSLLAAACGGRGIDAGVQSGLPENHPPVTHSIAAGMEHTCALRSQGLVCWGANERGELGTGSSGPAWGPVVATAAGTDVVEVAANSFQTCVRRSNGGVDCWGWNPEGGLGDGTREDRLVPKPVLDLTDALEVAAGGLSACARRADGTVACWGASPDYAPSQGSLRAVTVAGLQQVVEIRTGQPAIQYCARTSSGDVFCWKVDGSVPAPRPMPALAGARALAVADSVCVITASSNVSCVDSYDQPSKLESASDAIEIAGGSFYICWRRTTGGIRCWDRTGLLIGSSAGMYRDFMVDVPVAELALGQVHFCARLTDDGIACLKDPWFSMGTPGTDLVRVAVRP